MRVALILLAIACAFSAVALTDAIPSSQRVHHRFRQRQHADADTSADADVNAHVSSAAAAATTAEGAKMSAKFRAAMQQELERMNARDRVRLDAEFGSVRGQRVARAEAEALAAARAGTGTGTGVGTGAWDPVRTPAVCAAVWNWLAGLAPGGGAGGFVLMAGAGVTDAAVVTNWGGATLGAYNALVDNVHAADLIAWLRFKHAAVVAAGGNPVGAAGAVCTAAAMQIATAAHAARSAVAIQFAQYTMGVEWEVHGLQVDPPDTLAGNDPVTLAESGPATFGSKYLLVEADNSGNPNVAELHGYNIPELIFGPRGVDPVNALVTTPVVLDTTRVVANFKVAALALGTQGYFGNDNAARGFQYVSMTALAAAAHARNQGNNGGAALSAGPMAGNYHLTVIKDPTYELRAAVARRGEAYTGPRTEFAIRPTGVVHRQATPTALSAQMLHDYIQTNFLMPISALASAQFAGDLVERYVNHGGMGLGPVFVRGALIACQTAARDLLMDVNHFPAATMNTLTGAQRGDLLGVLTLFNYHFLYRWYCAAPLASQEVAWGDENPGYMFPRSHGAHWKNWFDIMPKTSVHKALELVHPAVAYVLYEWARTQHIGDNTNWAPTVAYYEALRAAMAASASPIVQGWAAQAAANTPAGAARRSWALGRLLIDLNMFNPATLRNPPATPPNAGHVYSTSPTHSRPPALLVGAAPDGVLSVVMEARDTADVLNQEIAINNADGVNTWLARHLAQKTWNYNAGTFAV